MTERQLRNMKVGGVDLDKVRQGCENLFKYLDENGFSLLETKYLMSSMGLVVEDIVKKDSLRKIAEFDYPSSVGSAFSCTAVSNKKQLSQMTKEDLGRLLKEYSESERLRF